MPVLVSPTTAAAAELAVSDLHCSSPSQHIYSTAIKQ